MPPRANGEIKAFDVWNAFLAPSPTEDRPTGFRGRPADRLVLQAVFVKGDGLSGKGGRTSVTIIAERTGLDRSTVCQSLQRLEGLGYLVREVHPYRYTDYSVNVERLLADAAGVPKSADSLTSGRSPLVGASVQGSEPIHTGSLANPPTLDGKANTTGLLPCSSRASTGQGRTAPRGRSTAGGNGRSKPDPLAGPAVRLPFTQRVGEIDG